MNKHIILLVLLLIKVSNAVGQGSSVSYRAVYDFDYTIRTEETQRNDCLFLDINKNGSLCYSYYTFESDSLWSTPDGDKVFRTLLTNAISTEGARTNAFPHKRSKFTVSKCYEQKEALVKESIDSDIYEYTVPMYDIIWTIMDSTDLICGYPCIKATGEYHGRRWEVWFTTEIPFSDGPWQLSGLPGLIVRAQDSDHLFCFKLTGFSRAQSKVDWRGQGKKTTRVDFLRRKKKALINSNAMTNAMLGTNTISTSKKEYVFLEADF